MRKEMLRIVVRKNGWSKMKQKKETFSEQRLTSRYMTRKFLK